MGYTHYWEIKQPKRLSRFVLAVIRKEVMAAYRAGLVQKEEDDASEPIVTDTVIPFNGVAELAHETFWLDLLDEHRTDAGTHVNFCKTARKPYDHIVMRVLIALQWDLKERLRVSSDGGFDREWQRERDYMAKTYSMVTYTDGTLVV